MKTIPEIRDIKTALRQALEGISVEAFIFGSRATGLARYNSDWDIGLLSKDMIPGCVMERIRESLDGIRTLHSFDVVDFNKVSDSFRKVAMAKIIPLIAK